MDSELATQQTALCGELENQIQANIEGVRVKNIGSQLILIFNNKSVATVYPVTGTTADLYCRDFADREIEEKDLNIETLLDLIRQIATLQAEQPITELGSRLDHTRGEDPLGANERNPKEKSRSEGKRKSAIAHNYEGGSPLALGESTAVNQTLEYLAEMLPVDSSELDGGKLTVTIDSASLIATVQPNGNFELQTFVAGELIQAHENIPASDLITLAFKVCGFIQTKLGERDDTEADDVSSSDVWETIRELAKENGESDDIIRNKNLFDLRQGLCVSRAPFTGSNSFLGETESRSKVKGDTMHNGSPVSLNEGRDASRPYADTLGGKVLRYVHGIGCVFVNKSDLPKEKFLSWNASRGHVELVEGKENVKRPSWHWRGWKR